MGSDVALQSALNESEALRYVLEGTVAKTGEPFFRALVENLSKALGYRHAWITELVDQDHLRSLAAWMHGELVPNFDYAIRHTPCEPVIRNRCVVHHPDNVQAAYPEDLELADIGAVSYLGVPLFDSDGRTLGHLALLGDVPKPTEPIGLTVLKIFAARAEVELQQVRAQRALSASEERASNLLESAMDGILVVDRDLSIHTVNTAAARMLDISPETPGSLTALLPEADRQRFVQLLEAESADEPYLLVNGLTLRTSEREFVVEGTVTHFGHEDKPLFALIFRDIGELLATEQRIERLLAENRYLELKLGALGSGEILGASPAIGKALDDAQQVAETNATVIIHGETGTGKELFARAVHNWSPRCDGSLIAVNCAALPAELIESEFFGHEKGAFTGASQRRVGRFALADGGTIFLDEVGDLPIALQAKLLRVLQEGQFEPVGSSRTQTVDVRVVAATNRDLFQAVQDGEFREDLYYRLSVFPIEVPPLRDRVDDVILLAEAFLDEFATQIGRRCAPLTNGMKARLLGYGWPGNVRELRNVMERAVICARDGQVDLDRALPQAAVGSSAPIGRADDVAGDAVLTVEALRELEKENIRRALLRCGGRVSGESGAAALLNMKPSTLSSRIRALGIHSP